MLNLYGVVLILVYPILLEDYYDDSLSNNSCFTKPASHIDTIHCWYIKGQFNDTMSVDQRNWTGDRTKSASFDYQQRDKKKVWHITVHYYFSQHPCPSEHKSSVWLTCTIRINRGQHFALNLIRFLGTEWDLSFLVCGQLDSEKKQQHHFWRSVKKKNLVKLCLFFVQLESNSVIRTQRNRINFISFQSNVK